MSDIMVLFTIVIIIWFGIGGYIFYLHKKVGKLEKEIEDISRDKNV